MSSMQGEMIENLEAQLRDEFLGDAKDRLNSCQCALYAMSQDDAEGQRNLLTLHHGIHALKGMGASFGFPSITLMTHRLEDYLADLPEFGEKAVSDIQVYLDRLIDIIDSGEDLGPSVADVLRTLPVRQALDIDDLILRDVYVLVITPSRAVAQGVGRELRACGYRVTFAQSSIEALEITATMKPAMVIAAATLDVISGFDLVRAISAMGSTADVRIGLLTSYGSDHPDLKRLPDGVHVVRLGNSLRDDLGSMLADFETSTKAA